jgi:hypothetical protein
MVTAQGTYILGLAGPQPAAAWKATLAVFSGKIPD